MSSIAVAARLRAFEQGEAVPMTRERPFGVSDRPIVSIPIKMAGESSSLFAYGIGDGIGPVAVHVCPQPLNRDLFYAMLDNAACSIGTIVDAWIDDPALAPQIITPSAKAIRLTLAVIDRMTFAAHDKAKEIARLLYFVNQNFEREDSCLILDAPGALARLYAMGQDEAADRHLGVVLEWFKPDDGNIHERVQAAELVPVSTATDPLFDREVLQGLVTDYNAARKAGDTVREQNVAKRIEQALKPLVEHRYGLICEAIDIMRKMPASKAADEMLERDRERFNGHIAYAGVSSNLLRRGFNEDMSITEFLDREMGSERIEALTVRSVSGARSAARLTGDVVRGVVVDRHEYKVGRKTIITLDVETTQARLPTRQGDRLVWLQDEKVLTLVMSIDPVAEGSKIGLEVVSGMTRPQPQVGDRVELANPVPELQRIRSRLKVAWSRLRDRQPRFVVRPRNGVRAQDLVSVVKKLRS